MYKYFLRRISLWDCVPVRTKLQLECSTPVVELLRRELLDVASLAQPNTALLLSGRLDSSAVLIPAMPVYTAGFEGAPDLKYARKVAEWKGIRPQDIHQIVWKPEEAMAFLEETVRFMQSYDLALLSDMVAYACMKKAKEDGFTTIRTGDPADEFFEGDGLELGKTVTRLRLQIKRIAERLGLKTDLPYENERVFAIARILRREDNIKFIEENTPSDFYAYYDRRMTKSTERGYYWTKMSLRQAMFGLLPNDVVYRMKAPLQYGAWTYKLTDALAGLIKSPEELAQIEEETRLLSTYDRLAHAGVYKIYRKYGLLPPKVTDPTTQIECKSCGGAIERGLKFCYTCGLSGEEVADMSIIEGNSNN